MTIAQLSKNIEDLAVELRGAKDAGMNHLDILELGGRLTEKCVELRAMLPEDEGDVKIGSIITKANRRFIKENKPADYAKSVGAEGRRA